MAVSLGYILFTSDAQLCFKICSPNTFCTPLCWLAHLGILSIETEHMLLQHSHPNRYNAPSARSLAQDGPAAAACSCQIPETIGIFSVPLQILALNQILDALFYKADIGREAPLQLRDHLHEQLRLT